jgi:hypothetical protein
VRSDGLFVFRDAIVKAICSQLSIKLFVVANNLSKISLLELKFKTGHKLKTFCHE